MVRSLWRMFRFVQARRALQLLVRLFASPPTNMASYDNSSLFNPNQAKALFSGAVAGAVSRTATAALERVKVMQQVSATNTGYNSTWGALVKMYREEGFLSYWKGNGTNVARIAPYSAIQFCSFDYLQQFTMPPGTETSTPRLLFTGALSGMISTFCCYPLDLVRSILTVQTSASNTKYKGMGEALVDIARTKGFLGLYKGINATLFGIAPYVAINFTTFDVLKRRFLPDRADPRFDLINLSLGACAGATAATITYPTDLIRRRMQLSGSHGMPVYKNSLDCVLQTHKAEGVRGLYKGLLACYLKVIPSMAIAFMTYERLRVLIGFQPPKKKISVSG